jgi:tetratricopeptide (TPR) repeat protein
MDLKLTTNNDQEFHTLTERIRNEVAGETGWKRLGQLLIKLSQYDKTEELYNVLLKQTSDEGEKALYYNQLGRIKDDQSDYENAIEYYENALEIYQKTVPRNYPSLAIFYNNIGLVYKHMKAYTNAISCYKKALEIEQKIVPVNYPHLATS